MKKVLSITILILLCFKNTSYASAINGSGELKMSDRAVNNFISYIKINKEVAGSKPDSFIISQNGDWSWYWYCAYPQCWQNDKPKIEECERVTGVICARFAKRRTIFWDNGINTKKNRAKMSSNWSDQKIRDELKRLGFIGDSSTTQTDDAYISKKDEQKADIAEQLRQIKKLYDDGVLTKEEFEKAKKMIIN